MVVCVRPTVHTPILARGCDTEPRHRGGREGRTGSPLDLTDCSSVAPRIPGGAEQRCLRSVRPPSRLGHRARLSRSDEALELHAPGGSARSIGHSEHRRPDPVRQPRASHRGVVSDGWERQQPSGGCWAGVHAPHNSIAIGLRRSHTDRCPSQALREVDPVANPLVGEPGSALYGRSSITRSTSGATSVCRAEPAPAPCVVVCPALPCGGNVPASGKHHSVDSCPKTRTVPCLGRVTVARDSCRTSPRRATTRFAYRRWLGR